MSGSGVEMRDSTSSESTKSEGSPRRDFAGAPTTPTMSPRWMSSSPVCSTAHRSWIRPERSTRSRKTSFPMSRRASTRPARRRVVSAWAPSSSGSASARTAAISSRSGKRFGAVIRASLLTPDRPADQDPDAQRRRAEQPGSRRMQPRSAAPRARGVPARDGTMLLTKRRTSSGSTGPRPPCSVCSTAVASRSADAPRPERIREPTPSPSRASPSSTCSVPMKP